MRKLIGVPALLISFVPALGQSPRAADDAQARPTTAATAAPVDVAEAHAPLPVTVWFKDGRRVRADLIQSGRDSFLLEIGGARLNVPADEVEGLLFQSRLVDSFGAIASNDMKARLDNFAIELQNDPTGRGFAFCYAGRRYRPGEARAYCDRMRDYMVNTRGIGSDRFVTVDGGFRETFGVDLWIVPYNTAPPAASPTVDPSEARPLPAKKKPTKGGKSKKAATKKRRGR